MALCWIGFQPGFTKSAVNGSRAMTPEFFDKILMEAAADAKRGFQIVRRTGQADDHPVSLGFPEGLYLKGVILSEYQQTAETEKVFNKDFGGYFIKEGWDIDEF